MEEAANSIGNDDDGMENREPASTEPAETPEPVTIAGTAVKGVLENGIVQAYRIDPDNTTGRPAATTPIGEPTRTNEAGEFTLSLPQDVNREWVVLEVRADEQTRMTCDATAGCRDARTGASAEFGEPVSLSGDFVLRSAVQAKTGAKSHLTPLSHIAVAKAQRSDLGLTDPGLRTAYRETSRYYGLDSDVLLSTRPKDITRTSTANGAERDQTRLGLINAAFMQKASESGTARALSQLLSRASGFVDADTVTTAATGDRRELLLDLAESAADVANELRRRNASLPAATVFSRAENWAVDLFEEAVSRAPETGGRQRTGEENENPDNTDTGSDDSATPSEESGTDDTSTDGESGSDNDSATGDESQSGNETDTTTGDESGSDGDSATDDASQSGSETDTTTGDESGSNSDSATDDGSQSGSETDTTSEDESASDSDSATNDESQSGSETDTTSEDESASDSDPTTGEDSGTDNNQTDAKEVDDSALLSWVAPGHRVNGDTLKMAELDGYTIQYGQEADNLSQEIEIASADTMEYTIDGLDEGEWFFRIRSHDDQGNDSAWSDLASKTIPGTSDDATTDDDSGATDDSTADDDSTTSDGTTTDSGSGTTDDTTTDDGSGTSDDATTGDDSGSTDDATTEPDDSALLSWVAPGHRENGDTISMAELDGYTIQYGQEADNLNQKVEIPLADTMEYEIDNLGEGEWFFRIRSHDDQGNDSAWSEVASKTIEL